MAHIKSYPETNGSISNSQAPAAEQSSLVVLVVEEIIALIQEVKLLILQVLNQSLIALQPVRLTNNLDGEIP